MVYTCNITTVKAERTSHLAGLAASKPQARSARGLGAVAAVLGLFVGVGALAEQWTTWQAESFGDRRLQKPTADECQIARALVRDHRDRDLKALLRSVGAGDEKMELRAFAWHSSGARIPPGMDWRNCPDLGPFVRAMGLARLASGETGPALYISRAAVNPAGDAATVRETFRAPKEVQRQAVMRVWTVELRRGPDGVWRPVRRTDAALPDNDFRPH
jgi:hypothetical protein